MKFLSRIFSSKSSFLPADKNACTSQSGDCQKNIFEQAIHQRLDNMEPASKKQRLQLKKLDERLLSGLMPVGECVTKRFSDGKKTEGYRTSFSNVFKHSVTNLYDLSVGSKQKIVRSRAEIELHILLESHDKAKHGANGIDPDTVINVNEIKKPGDESGKRKNAALDPCIDRSTPATLPASNHPNSNKNTNAWYTAKADGLGMPVKKRKTRKQTRPALPTIHEHLKVVFDPHSARGIAQVADDDPEIQETFNAQDASINLQNQNFNEKVVKAEPNLLLNHDYTHGKAGADKISARFLYKAPRPSVENPPAQSAKRRLYEIRPDDFRASLVRKLDRAIRHGIDPIKIDVGSYPRQVRSTTTGTPSSILKTQTIALAIATVSRYTKNRPGFTPAIIFQCNDPADLTLMNDLIERVGELTDKRVYQALLRPEIKLPSQATEPSDFLSHDKLATFVPQKVNVKSEQTKGYDPLIISPPPRFIESLNNVAFSAAASKDITSRQLRRVPEPSTDTIRAAGTIIVEENGDGRVWVVAPTNQFMNLNNTFPKGQREPGLSAQETAIKEAREESGLEVELTGFLCDAGRDNATRYYLARRIGGTPENVEWESQAVRLVPKAQLLDLFNNASHYRDLTVAQQLLRKSSF